tara:strand:+ start:1148 stop:1675 length:528 start_codon:yes stop_codon:yes gene_type:complete
MSKRNTYINYSVKNPSMKFKKVMPWLITSTLFAAICYYFAGNYLITNWISIAVSIFGLIFGLIVLGPFIMKAMAHYLQTSFTKKYLQSKSVDAKLDKNLMKAILTDITAEENPIGLILSFFPNTGKFLNKNPSRVIGFINLIQTIPDIKKTMDWAGKLPQIQQLTQKDTPKDTQF